MKLFLLAFVFCIGVSWGQYTPAGGGGGAGAIACAGTPGNTTGSYRQQCQTGTGALYTCNNAAGCTVAADWAAVAGGAIGAASGDLSGSYPGPTVAKVNGGSLPTSQAYVGTDSGGKIVAATAPPTTLTGSTSISFSAIADGACGSSTVTITGAVTGDGVAPRWPSTLETGLFGSMIVTAADTVQVRLCNLSGAAITPATQTFGAKIVR